MQDTTAPGLISPDFQDTRLAFSHKSDEELRRTYSLFKKIDSPFLVKIGPPMVNFALKLGLPVQGMIRRTIFDIFCGGESLEDTRGRSAQLFKQGVMTILDYSVEGEKSERGYDATRDEILRTLEHGAREEAVAFSAMKVTGIAPFDLLAKAQSGLELSSDERAALDRGHSRLQAICAHAAHTGTPLFIDAEESWIQGTIDAWAEEMMAQYNREKPLIYTTVQLYRHDGLAYLKKLVEKATAAGWIAGVKLVRGAYIEKENERAASLNYPTPMQPDKASTDRDYNAALTFCVERLDRVAICAGSHNEESAALLARLLTGQGHAPAHPHVLFAQLLGMSDHISFTLAHHGFRVAKYLPYGPVAAVLPYLFRRANENTSVAGQSSRELMLLKKEMQRRGI